MVLILILHWTNCGQGSGNHSSLTTATSDGKKLLGPRHQEWWVRWRPLRCLGLSNTEILGETGEDCGKQTHPLGLMGRGS